MPGEKVPFLQDPGRSDPKVPRRCGNLGLLWRGLCNGSDTLHLSETALGGGTGTVPRPGSGLLACLTASLCLPVCSQPVPCVVGCLSVTAHRSRQKIFAVPGFEVQWRISQERAQLLISTWLNPGPPLLGKVTFRVEGGIYGFSTSKGSGE